MKVVCKQKTNSLTETTYTGGEPKENADVVIYYKCKNQKDIDKAADILESIAAEIRNWPYKA